MTYSCILLAKNTQRMENDTRSHFGFQHWYTMTVPLWLSRVKYPLAQCVGEFMTYKSIPPRKPPFLKNIKSLFLSPALSLYLNSALFFALIN